MKKILIFFAVISLVISVSHPYYASAQEVDGNGNVTKETRNLEKFTALDAGGAFTVILSAGENQQVVVETDQNLLQKVNTEVKGNTLFLSTAKMGRYTALKVYITTPDLEKITVQGACNLSSSGVYKADMLEIISSGASNTDLDVDIVTLRTEVSGAANLTLKGFVEQHSTIVNGAGNLKAYDLETTKTTADISGAGHAYVNATNELFGETSGAGSLEYKGEPEFVNLNNLAQIDVPDEDYHYRIDDDYDYDYDNYSGDTTKVNISGFNIEVIEGEDTTKVRVGNHVIIVDEDGDVKINRSHDKPKFNGHWAGFDIGFNGYADKDFSMNFPGEYEYLDLRMEKSVIVNINFFEQNVALAKNQKWGLLTGLGLSLPNYKFDRQTMLNNDSSMLIGYIAEDISLRKTKLSMMYLSIPLMFEFQTNRHCKKNSFHISAGMIANARLMSWTKVYYNEYNKEFTLTRYNTETGMYEPEFTAVSPNESKIHNHDDWFLQPFKFDATVRIGWGIVNLWATYGVNTMFRDGKGPEVYPWTAGITLLNF